MANYVGFYLDEYLNKSGSSATPSQTSVLTSLVDRLIYTMGNISQPAPIIISGSSSPVQVVSQSGGTFTLASGQTLNVNVVSGFTAESPTSFNFPDTQKVLALELPLPDGAATELSLEILSAKIPHPGATSSDCSLPVVLATDQAPLHVIIDTQVGKSKVEVINFPEQTPVAFPATQDVRVINFPDTQTIVFPDTQHVVVGNLPTNQAVSITSFPTGQTINIGNLPATQVVSVSNLPSNQTVSVSNFPTGQTINVGNLPSNQQVTVTNLPTNQNVTVTNFPTGQTLNVANFPTTQAVTVSNLPANQTVSVSNFPTGQTVNAIIAAGQTLNVGNFPANQPVTVTNLPTNQTVSVSNFPATQGVAVSNFPASQSVTVSNFPTNQGVTVSNFPATQPVTLPANTVLTPQNTTATIEALSTKSASGFGTTQTNNYYTGAYFFISITNATGVLPTLVVKIQAQDPVSGNWIDIPNAVTSSLALSSNTLIIMNSGISAVANLAVSLPLPRVFRVAWVIGGTTPTFTFSVGAQFLI